MNIVIVEDEAPAARRLQKLLKENDPSIKIIASLDSIESTITWLSDNPPPDLFFMDIQLADGLCFEIFRRKEVTSPVIFTTAYDEYALRAFKVNSIDYLLKPIDSTDLKRSLEKYKQLKNNFSPKAEGENKLEKLLHDLIPSEDKYKTRFLVKSGQRYIPVDTDAIAYFYTEDKVVLLKTFQKNVYVVDSTLDHLEQQLNPKEFFRVNRQFILHVNAINHINTFFNGKLKIQAKPDNEHEIIISREKASDFKNWLDH